MEDGSRHTIGVREGPGLRSVACGAFRCEVALKRRVAIERHWHSCHTSGGTRRSTRRVVLTQFGSAGRSARRRPSREWLCGRIRRGGAADEAVRLSAG